MAKKRAADKAVEQAVDPGKLQRYVEEIDRFADLLRESQADIARLKADLHEKKDAYDEAKKAVQEAKDVEHETVAMLLKFIAPGTHEILPLFDTMEPADEETHGENAGEWRKEPIARLGLSAASLRSLVAADVVLIGQLQDLMLEHGLDWYLHVDGIGQGMADAVEQKFHAYINGRSGGGK